MLLKTSFHIKFGLVAMSNMHYEGCVLCDDKPTGTETFFVILLKRNIQRAISNEIITEYGTGALFSFSCCLNFVCFSSPYSANITCDLPFLTFLGVFS